MRSVAKSIQCRIAELSMKNKSKIMKKEKFWFGVSPGYVEKLTQDNSSPGLDFTRQHPPYLTRFLVLVHIFLPCCAIYFNHPVFTGKNRKVDRELQAAEMKMWYSVYLVIAASERNKFDTKRNLPPQWAPTLTSHKESLVAAILSNVVAK
jgi:hypothetical protein